MSTKARPAKVKAGEDQGLALGEFEAIVAVFGNTDSMGDRVVPGAFEKSLAAWGERGKPIPVIFTHSHGDAFAYIGDVLQAEERENEGLWIKGRLDVDPEAENPTARQVYRLLKGGRIDNWSFAYDVEDEAPAEDGANELRQLQLYEVGPTLIGANQETRTLAVKTGTKEPVSDKPWSDFPDSAFDDEQYARACILDRGPDAGTAKQRYSLPVREPDGTLNRNACHNAAAVLGGGRGGVDATEEQKTAAARKLVSLYRSQLDEDPPDDLAEMAKATRPQAKAGRTLSGKNEQKIRDAISALQDVLSSLGEANDDGKASDHGPAKDETGDGKSEEPSPASSASYRSAQMQLLALTQGEGGSP